MEKRIVARDVKVKIDDDETKRKRYKIQVKINDRRFLHYGSDVLVHGDVETKSVTMKFSEFSNLIALAVEFGAACYGDGGNEVWKEKYG